MLHLGTFQVMFSHRTYGNKNRPNVWIGFIFWHLTLRHVSQLGKYIHWSLKWALARQWTHKVAQMHFSCTQCTIVHCTNVHLFRCPQETTMIKSGFCCSFWYFFLEVNVFWRVSPFWGECTNADFESAWFPRGIPREFQLDLEIKFSNQTFDSNLLHWLKNMFIWRKKGWQTKYQVHYEHIALCT